MLNKLPLACQRLRGTARTDTRYTAVMFYERTRLGAAASGHFLEGLAPGLPLFSGAPAVVMSATDISKLKLRDVVADRIRTVKNLEEMPKTSARLKRLVADYTVPDAPPGLPGRVHVFLARMRAICQGIAAAHGATVDVDIDVNYPVTFNNAEETEFASGIAIEVAGAPQVNTDINPVMGGEDFSYMLEARPGAFIFAGNGDTANLHNPAYDFNDELIPHGISYWVRLTETALGRA